MTEIPMLDDVTLAAVRAESAAAHAKHGDMSLLNPGLSDGLRLAALVEEVGEVAHLLTYDTDARAADLVRELIQVGNVALSWAQAIDQCSSCRP